MAGAGGGAGDRQAGEALNGASPRSRPAPTASRIGGALSANVHGRGLTCEPIIDDVESFTLVDADGELVTCSRDGERRTVPARDRRLRTLRRDRAVTLRLAPRRKVERVVEVRSVDGLMAAFDRRIADGFLYGDFQFAIDPAPTTSCAAASSPATARSTTPRRSPPDQQALSHDDWRKLLYPRPRRQARRRRRLHRALLATSGRSTGRTSTS